MNEFKNQLVFTDTITLYYMTRIFLFAALLSLLSSSCGAGDSPRAAAPDVSGIPVEIHLQRFDQALFALDTNQLDAKLPDLAQKYPDFFKLYTTHLINDPSDREPTPAKTIRNFITAPEVRHLYDTVQVVYGDLRWLEKDLTQMFKYYKYYFPQKPVPQVLTMITDYANDAFTAGDSLCGIGLDMFLGEDYPIYQLFENTSPEYIRRQFKKEYMTVRLAKALAQNILDTPSGERLLDQMLDNGKQLYIADVLLPDSPDSLKMGYTKAQLDGCISNEQEIWARLLDENLLYSTDVRKLRKLVSPSPNAPVLFQEAPGEVGNWVGWQIVKSYMKRNPTTTMDQLLKVTDSQKFLEAAKYKPKRR